MQQVSLHKPESDRIKTGRLTLHFHNWVRITNNSFVLKIIRYGLKLQFYKLPPVFYLKSFPFSRSRSLSIDTQISTLYDKTAIAVITPSSDQYVNSIFDVPKKDTPDCRVILNLKILNNFIRKIKFKLEGYETIISMINQFDFMCSIDLTDAFLMFSMHPEFFRFLCFEWDGVRYCYKCMPFGLTSAPRIFSKVLKSVLVFLRSRSIRVSAWFDDLIIIANSVSLLLEHLYFVRMILRSLGFLINNDKSNLVPSQSMLHLGYIWNSVDLTLSVPMDKVANLKNLCSKALNGPVSLRFLQRILGTIESFKRAFPYAALHYRQLQKEVSTYISEGSDWDFKIKPSSTSCSDLKWWVDCPLSLMPRSLAPFDHRITLTTDSSRSGWGGFSSFKDGKEDKEVFGFWSDEELKLHINALETKAVLLCFFSFFREESNTSILIKSDNCTAVSYINHLGGVRSPVISNLIIELYEFCLPRKITIKASFLKGRLNARADALSRRSRDHCYALPQTLFSLFCSNFDLSPSIDLFATRDNCKLENYYSDGPDPKALGFDAFSQDWPKSIYAFPPTPLIAKFLSYFISYEVESGLVIVPYWPAQPFFPVLLDLLINPPVLFPVSSLQGSPLQPRPLSLLLACNISVRPDKKRAYLQTLSNASCKVSELRHYAHTADTGRSLPLGVVEGKLVRTTCLSTL